MTNFEKIQKMSPQEMARFFIKTRDVLEKMEWGVDADRPTMASVLVWLESEAVE